MKIDHDTAGRLVRRVGAVPLVPITIVIFTAQIALSAAEGAPPAVPRMSREQGAFSRLEIGV